LMRAALARETASRKDIVKTVRTNFMTASP
jgi:hypothetical protein